MKQSKNNVLVFGYFGYVNNQLDGQTVKTRAIYNLVKDKADVEVSFADTQEFRHNPKSIFRFFRDLIRCTTLLWLPAHNNLRYLFPFIWYASKLFKVDIIYVVVGGWLSTILETLPFHRKRLKRLKAILVENKTTVKELEEAYGFGNLDVIPNFRKETPTPRKKNEDGALRLVFMARVNRMKGLDVIGDLCNYIEHNGYTEKISIDFYGPINNEDGTFFRDEILNRYPFVNYGGIIQPAHINMTLVNYDAMLLPTRYFTEGFPGSVLDAYQAGIPVIATRWKHATEFINDGCSGIIIDFDNPREELIAAVIGLYQNPQLLSEMKENAYFESLKYTPEEGWKILKQYL